MFKSYLLTTKLNLMTKMNLVLSQKRGGLKVLAFVAFFFMSLGSMSAQYVGANEATILLKQEVSVLDVQAGQTSNNDELMNIQFKKDYFMLVMNDLENGESVDAAIQVNRPRAKPYVHSSGWIVYSSHGETLKQEVADLVSYTEELLSE